jgi:hypothetical protein
MLKFQLGNDGPRGWRHALKKTARIIVRLAAAVCLARRCLNGAIYSWK